MSVIINMWNEDHVLQFVKQEYLNGNLAIEVMSEDEEYGGWEPWCSLTVNLPGFMHDKNTAFLDTNNCSEEILDWLFKNKYVVKVEERQSGFCRYPLVQFSNAFMETILIEMEDLMEHPEENEEQECETIES